ncbi:phosphotransferase [Murinocardiopsis flavida]|nr:phosphotransferase [Murinocardiopsis flavida]
MGSDDRPALLDGTGGGRVTWDALPPRVRAAVEEGLGAPVLEARSQAGGFSPGLASRLLLADGGRAFVKAAGPELNPDTPGIHRREIANAAAIPAAAPVPNLLWSLDEPEEDGGWVALAFADVDGRQPRLPWRDEELDRVIAAADALHDSLTPVPPGTFDTGPFPGFGYWRRLAAKGTAPAGLDPWCLRNLDLLARLEAETPEAVAGDTLLHGDLRADNILLVDAPGTPHDVVFVDWPWACVGAAWLDTLIMLPSIAMQGGPTPADAAARIPRLRAADPDAVTAVLAVVTGFLLGQSLRPPPPGLPTVRGFQAAQGRIALDWLRTRVPA